MAVSGTVDSIGGYQFRLLNLAAATPITPGTVVSNALDVAKETDLYRFSVTAGSRYFFDWLGGTVSGNTYWRLLDPFGVEVFATGPNNAGLRTLAETGTYTLAVEGYMNDASGGNYSFNVVPVVGGTQGFAMGNTVTGAIATPGQVQRHTFSVASAARLYFDSLTNQSEIRWSLDGPIGNIIANRAFNASDGVSGYSVFEATPGDYTVTVFGNGDATGGYQFRILDFASATPITTNSTVNGSLNPGNETELYRFTSAAGDRIQLDYLGKTQLPNAYWRLVSPYGAVLYNNSFSADSTIISLGSAGTYTLTIEGQHSDFNAGTSSFSVSLLSNIPPSVLTGDPLVIGALISSNLPTAASTNAYLFTLAGPAQLYFDALTNVAFKWSLTGPSGLVANNRDFLQSDGADIGDPRLNLPAGNYQLRVTGAAGAYAFRLLDFASAIPFSPGNVVSNALSPARSTTLYQFTAGAGQRLSFDGRPVSGFAYTPYCRIYGPLGNPVLARNISEDQADWYLPNSGTYVLTVEGRILDDNASGNYAFNLIPVTDGTNSLTIGATISGSFATLGQAQRYFLQPYRARADLLRRPDQRQYLLAIRQLVEGNPELETLRRLRWRRRTLSTFTRRRRLHPDGGGEQLLVRRRLPVPPPQFHQHDSIRDGHRHKQHPQSRPSHGVLRIQRDCRTRDYSTAGPQPGPATCRIAGSTGRQATTSRRSASADNINTLNFRKPALINSRSRAASTTTTRAGTIPSICSRCTMVPIR